MGKRGSFSGDGTELPFWSLRAGELDRSFYKDAYCRKQTSLTKIAWTAEIKRSYEVDGEKCSGYSLIKKAMEGCKECPVQWQCVTVAIEGEEVVGTWADKIENVRWLSRFPKWKESVQAAEINQVPVQTLIKMLRQHA